MDKMRWIRDRLELIHNLRHKMTKNNMGTSKIGKTL